MEIPPGTNHMTPSGHFRHDYLIKYAYFSKCYLERFASINDPEIELQMLLNGLSNECILEDQMFVT